MSTKVEFVRCRFLQHVWHVLHVTDCGWQEGLRIGYHAEISGRPGSTGHAILTTRMRPLGRARALVCYNPCTHHVAAPRSFIPILRQPIGNTWPLRNSQQSARITRSLRSVLQEGVDPPPRVAKWPTIAAPRSRITGPTPSNRWFGVSILRSGLSISRFRATDPADGVVN